ncbi:SURF1 family protein [Paraglaciecola aestuariivivens]
MFRLISRLPIVATICTFVCVVIMFALGMWQLQRAEEKSLRLAAIHEAQQSQPLSLTEVLAANLEQMLDIPVSIQGQAQTQSLFLVDNKIHQGRVGYQVLLPIQTARGLLVSNLGWVSATNSRDKLPEIDLGALASNFNGVVSIPSHNTMVTETALVDGLWPKVIQQPDLTVIQQHLQQPILPFVLLLDPDPTQDFVRNWQPVVMPPEKHLGYAMQWFLLAFAAVLVFSFAQRNKIRRKNSGHT